MKTRCSTRVDALRAVAALYLEFGTWRKVAAYLSAGQPRPINPGLLSRIAAGEKDAPNSVRRALGLTFKPEARHKDRMYPGYRKEVDKFIAWARGRERRG